MKQALLLLLIVGCFVAISQLFVLEFYVVNMNFLWEENWRGVENETQLFTSPITFNQLPFPSKYLEIVNVYKDYLVDNEEEEDQKVNKENQEEHFLDLPPFEQESKNFTRDDPIIVELPDALPHCYPVDIKLIPDGWDEDEILSNIRNEITVQIECYTVTHHYFIKFIPILIGSDPSFYFARFYPDEGLKDCLITVDSTKFRLEGELRRAYTVTGIPGARPWCWNCEAHFHRNLPMPYDFVLADNNLNVLWDKPVIEIPAGAKLILWIIPVSKQVLDTHSNAAQNLLFNGWLESDTIIQKVDVSTIYNTDKGGYRVEIIGRDVEKFKLYITLNWVFPGAEIGDAVEPILVGTHIHHETSICDFDRAQIINSEYPIYVRLGKYDSPIIFPKVPKQCTSATEPGRWLNLAIEDECHPPYCKGDRFGTMISSFSWQGSVYPWIWVPYTCHYRYFNANDFKFCANQLGLKWFHFFGDSLAREHMAYLMSMMGNIDTEKFDKADLKLNGTDIRVTFVALYDLVLHGVLAVPPDHKRPISFTKDLFDHFNLLQPNKSSPIILPEMDVDIPEIETETPDVLLMNPATAYCLFLQTKETYTRYIKDFSELVSSGTLAKQSYWYQAPYLHGTAHAGTEHITQERSRIFTEITKEFLSPKLKYLDSIHITQSRPMESWDGLHYLSGYETWTGHVAATFIQAWLNEVFTECKID